MNAEKVRELFVELVANVPRERWNERLAECAGQDEDLRQRVKLLLAAHQDDSFLASPAPALGGTIDDPIAERPGTAIGPYKLMEQIGEGGMGLVFVADQEEPIRRCVALKVIKPGMDSKQVIARFEAERQALAMMDHPNIAHVLDAGTTDSGRPYFVMELVNGVPITAYCDQQKLTLGQRLELFLLVCQAVQHAHQKGIIHRDIKPSNVMVTVQDVRPVVKIIDFGIAKATQRHLTYLSVYTGFSQLVGTPLYMSPEQTGMSGPDVDTRSDIYSLGVVLYELLTGTTPFDAERFKQADYDELRRIIREEEPVRPSLRLSTLQAAALGTVAEHHGVEPRRLSQQVRGELDWIVMKCLEKDRNRRYETASALAADVQRHLADEPVRACPPSAAYRMRKFARRNKGRLAIATCLILALTVMAASVGWAVRDRAAWQAEVEQRETARLARVEDHVRDSLNAARALLAENKVASAREKLVQARAQLGNDEWTLGNLAAEVGAGATDLERFQQFLELIERAHQEETAPLLEPRLSADSSPGSAGTRAPTRTAERQHTAKISFLLEALQRYDVLVGDDWISNLEGGLLGKDQAEQIRRLTYEELIWLAADLVRRQQEHRSERRLSQEASAQAALVYLGKAESAHLPTPALYALRALCRKTLGEEAAAQADTQLAAKTPPTMAVDYHLRGQAAYDAKQLAEGVQAFEAALSLEPTHYWSMMKLGYCLCDLGQGPTDFAEAARVFTGCILNRPDHAHAYHCRAIAYAKLRRYKEAEADSSKAIELDPQHARASYNRGIIYHELGKFDKALTDFSKTIELDPKNALAVNNRGIEYQKLGQRDKALADFSAAIELDSDFALAWYNRGLAYSKQGQPEKSVADFSRAIELNPTYKDAWYNRGHTYNELGQPDKALVDFSKTIELDPNFAPAWNNRGNSYNKRDQPDKAIADYSKAIELDPQFALAWFNRGLAYGKRGQPDLGVADFSKVIELDPQYAPAWYSRGVAHSQLVQLEQAIGDFTKGIELDPKHPQLVQAYLLRAQAYSRLGQFEQARTDYQKALQRAPSHAGAHNALAWLLATCPDARLCEPDQALELAKKAVQLEPKAGHYWKTLGVAHYRAGDWNAAVGALDESLKLSRGGDALGRLFLAMAHWKLGNTDVARKAYGQAVAWLEKNKEALKKDKGRAEELRRFRQEAEEVLEMTNK